MLVMEVYFDTAASLDLQQFVDGYRAVFRGLFIDSGLWNEDEIITRYERNAKILHDLIVDAIRARLEGEVVFGRKSVSKKWQQVVLRVKGRLIIAFYNENKRQGRRIVAAILIDQPIS